jgi:hypothetical protein
MSRSHLGRFHLQRRFFLSHDRTLVNLHATLGGCIGVHEPAGLIDQVVGCITNHKEEKDKKGRKKRKDLVLLLANTTSRGKRKEKSRSC